jgi:transglutaminase-like putative cysteine protease
MNVRMSIIAAVAVVLASLSLNAVLQGNGWLGAGIGAVIVVAAAGVVTRLSTMPAAVATSCLVLIAVVPLLAAPGWQLRTTGLVLVALTAASATGRRTLRGVAVISGYLAALLIYLNLVFARAASFAWIIPTDHSMNVLGRLVPTAFDDFKFSPPVPDIRPVSLVAAAGIGLIAIIVDIVAVRLRRPAVAGVPLLVLFSVPVASNLKTFGVLQTVAFAAALAGFLALLSTDGRARLRMWGRLVTFRYVQSASEAGAGPDTRELAASGRRIGLAAVCLAVIIPIILPTVHSRDVFGTSDNGKPRDVGAGLDAFLRVQHQLTEQRARVLTYTTNADNALQQYFQVFVLNYSSAQNQWLPQFPLGFGGTLPAIGTALPYSPQGQLPSTPVATVKTTVQIGKGQGAPTAYLPVPYAPVDLAIGGTGWQELSGSLMVLSAAQGLSDLTYTVTSHEADPTPADISNNPNGVFVPAIIQSQYGNYTGPDASRLLAIARQHTQGALTQLQVATDLQNWLESSAFTYTLKPNLPKSHWLLRFLTTDRQGYCQQFAWAMAVLARQVGIPSRIVVGYTGGTSISGSHGRWQVTTADAHAWPELYFAGEGWLRFEPTPHGAGGQGTASVPGYASGPSTGPDSTLPGGSSQSQSGKGGASGSKGKTSALNRLEHGQAGAAGRLGGATSIGLWLAIGIPVLVVLLLTWPAIVRVLTRRRRWLAAAGDAGLATAAWRELTDDLADLGLHCAPGETPRSVARRVSQEASLEPPTAEALTRIATAEERARYARLALSGAGLASDVRAVRQAIAASVPRAQRLRATFLPASTLSAARRGLERAGGMLSWLDSSWPAVRRELQRRLAHRSA